MKHFMRRLGVVVVLVAGIISHPEAGEVTVMSVTEYVKNMEGNGWIVEKSENIAGNVLIALYKEEKGPEGHGIFRIKWDNRVNWMFTYYPQENNILKLVIAEGERMEKAPFLGKWTTVEQYDHIPDSILAKELLVGNETAQDDTGGAEEVKS